MTTIIIDTFIKKDYEVVVEVESILKLNEKPFFSEQNHEFKKNMIFVMIEYVLDEEISDKDRIIDI